MGFCSDFACVTSLCPPILIVYSSLWCQEKRGDTPPEKPCLDMKQIIRSEYRYVKGLRHFFYTTLKFASTTFRPASAESQVVVCPCGTKRCRILRILPAPRGVRSSSSLHGDSVYLFFACTSCNTPQTAV